MAKTTIPIELSSTPSIVDGGNATAITIDSSENVTFAGGLVIPTTITHAGDTDTKLDFNQANTLRLITGDNTAWICSASSMVINEDSIDFDFRVESNGNANMLFVDGGNDRVGIGTSSPSAKLELNVPTGDGLLIGSADIATIKMKNVGGGVKNWGFATTNLAASDFGIYQSNSNGGDPITAGSPKIYFNGSGNVGIGATSIDSDSLVHLKSNIPNIFFEDTDDNQDWRLEATSVFKLQDVTRGAEVFRIDSSGNRKI